MFVISVMYLPFAVAENPQLISSMRYFCTAWTALDFSQRASSILAKTNFQQPDAIYSKCSLSLKFPSKLLLSLECIIIGFLPLTWSLHLNSIPDLVPQIFNKSHR